MSGPTGSKRGCVKPWSRLRPNVLISAGTLGVDEVRDLELFGG